MSNQKIDEIKADISELEMLQTKATRQKVKDIFSIELHKLSSELRKLEEKRLFESSPAVAAVNSTAKRYEVKLNNYAWDQTVKFVKFYITLPKVHMLPPANIYCNFTNKSLELFVKDLDNKDYALTINKLLNAINPEQSSWKIKKDMVMISVAKVEQVNWSHVTEVEKKTSDSKKMVPDADKMDASDGLISIMKNMYEQGDDELKRTIAKAWVESQSKGPAF